jgi:SAM-dependent methyltransferase
MPPQVLLVIAAYLPPEWEVRFVDENIAPASDQDFARADAVLASGMHVQREEIVGIARRAHRFGRCAALGGPSVSVAPELYGTYDTCVFGNPASARAFGKAETRMPRFHYTNVAIDAVCPVCRGFEAKELYRATSREAAEHFLTADGDRLERLVQHIEMLWRGDKASVLRCEDCGFCFAHPYVAGDATFYELAYDRAGYPAWNWEHEVTLDAMERRGMLAPGCEAHMLEIGAGSGNFVRRLMERGVSAERIFCTEYSEFGRRQISRTGIECAGEDIRSSRFDGRDGKFDAVCLFQVLEHMDRLDELFARLCQLTKAGGDVFIAVPNERRIEFNETHGALLDMPPNHIGRWNRGCFERISERHGCRLVEHRYEEQRYIQSAFGLAVYFYLRRAQHRLGFANRIERMDRGFARKLLRFPAVAAAAVPNLAAFLRVAAPGLGESQWVHLTKP